MKSRVKGPFIVSSSSGRRPRQREDTVRRRDTVEESIRLRVSVGESSGEPSGGGPFIVPSISIYL